MVDLAKADDPYIDNSGKLLKPDTTQSADALVYDETRAILPKFQSFQPYNTLSQENLPEPDTQEQTVIAAIVALKLIGLSDVDMADVLGTHIQKIQQLIKSPAIQTTFELMYQNIINVNADNVQGRIASHANSAVDVVVGLMENNEAREDVRLKAAQDILDRSGSNPDQFFSKAGAAKQADDELRIVIMDEQGVNEKVKVEIKKGS